MRWLHVEELSIKARTVAHPNRKTPLVQLLGLHRKKRKHAVPRQTEELSKILVEQDFRPFPVTLGAL